MPSIASVVNPENQPQVSTNPTVAAAVETTRPKQTWGFQKGVSGNPAGRPLGARHKTTIMAEKLMQDSAEKVINAVVDAAAKGDMMAAKIIVDRACAGAEIGSFFYAVHRRRGRPETSGCRNPDAVSEGALTPGEAKEFSETLQKFARTICDRHKRLPELQATDERLRRAFYVSEK
jgi:hypothetical protein